MTKRPVPQYDFKAFGAAIKAARKGRKESRKKVCDEMYMETEIQELAERTAAKLKKLTEEEFAGLVFLPAEDMEY